MTNWMQTFTGKAFSPLTATPDDVDIIDIAHALGMVCRYAGHCESFYSVAEHCLLMSYAVDPPNALWALLHDATEAYVGDMVRPLKVDMPEYRAVEDRLAGVIATKFGLSPQTPDQVKEYDLRIVNDERAAFMAPSALPWDMLAGTEPLGVKFWGLNQYEAGEEYLNRFYELTKTPG